MSARQPVALFCGSREWTDRERIRRDLESLPEGSVVIEGGARGADRIARAEAQRLGLHVATVNALWDFYGRPAGFRRNEGMAVVHCQRATYDVYVGRGRDPRTGRPGEWGNRYSHRPSRVPGTILVANVEEAIACHKHWLWGQIRSGRLPLEEAGGA